MAFITATQTKLRQMRREQKLQGNKKINKGCSEKGVDVKLNLGVFKAIAGREEGHIQWELGLEL